MCDSSRFIKAKFENAIGIKFTKILQSNQIESVVDRLEGGSKVRMVSGQEYLIDNEADEFWEVINQP